MAVIRDAAPDDAAAIAAVEVASWQAAYRGLLPDDLLSNMSVVDDEHHWLEPSPTSRTGATLLSSTSLGACRASLRIGPPREADADDAAAGELHALYLSPSAWGRGRGAKLHACALHRLRASGFECVCL